MTVELGAVAHRSSGLAILSDSGLESLTLGNSGNVDLDALSEDVSLDLVINILVLSVLKSELLHKSLARNTSLIELTLHRLVY